MDSGKLGIAVFGVGRWGVHLVRIFLHHPAVTVMAIADPNAASLQALAQRFALDDSITLTTDWEVAMNTAGVQAVAIVTPATTHYPLIQAALKRGLHVLAEKPLTLDYSEAIALCDLAKQQQRQLVIDHTYLFHPAVRAGKAALEKGLPGDLRYGYATRTHLGPVRQDVDALWDLAIHDIAILNHWLGETPTAVQAQGNTWLQMQHQAVPLFPAGLSDLIWVKLVYPSGFEAMLHLCWLNPDKQRRLCIVGSQGSLIFDELNSTSPLTFQQGRLEHIDAYYIPVDQHYQPLPIESGEPLQQVCDHFLECVRDNTPSTLSSGWVGAHLVQILCALTTSLNQGGEWVTL